MLNREIKKVVILSKPEIRDSQNLAKLGESAPTLNIFSPIDE